MRHISQVLLLLALVTATPAFGQAPVDDATVGSQLQPRRNYQVTVGYSNDNVILASVVDAVMEDGIDDLVTTAFWSQLAIQDNNRRWFVNVGLDVLTNRQELYRADLMTVRASTEMSAPLGTLQLGAGLVARGKFGGSAIQNTYHSLTSIPTVHLPYVRKAVVAPQLDAKFTTRSWRLRPLVAEAYSSASHATAAGPSKMDAGVVVACCARLQGRTYAAQLQGRFGYVGYFSLDEVIAPMFGRGFNTGLLASVGRRGAAELAFWITRNQFGVDNLPQFGMSVTVGWNGVHTRINR
jgi:hypothetical protein